ncbi:GNAT family N-acetyltransferase [Agromyces atrinae]|uniref:GNAT family N-acetyltransferase n=1 Tax=Agromyces atrinae TaxID=592376 RepID=UPI001F5A0857|nr:GNAT family N-acetyltransferase [Agromyces atrinae]MCI2957357.1 GNAT family N-acetyltransferase [Agromyces atrinae]
MTIDTPPTSTAAPAAELLDVDWFDPRAVELRAAMDVEMGERYGDRSLADLGEEALTAFVIDPDDMIATVIAVVDGVPVGHAALRALGDEFELKRLITLEGYRGRGISRALIERIEAIARERGGTRVILQTGDRQPDAVRLYEWLGYEPIPIFAPYEPITFSRCFARSII